MANIINYTNVININSENWIYGDLTETELSLKLFNYMLENNVTSCPIDQPFILVNTSECMNCGNDTPIFDVSKEICVSCPNDTSFNSSLHKCEKEEIQCEVGQVYNEETQSCVCDDSHPFFDGVTCLSCYLPKYWDEK